ncbi:MAG: response regulator [Candidatus Eremiobacterota bacterium]
MKKILVIEDEPSVLANILKTLEFENYQASGAENGLSGLARAKELFPDLIICDVMMPEMDGYSVLSELRKDPLTATIPFIFLTAKADRLEQRQGMELGADDYITKPFTRKELLSAINTRLKKQEIIHNKSREKLDELRTSIARALPHEFRSPLNGILGLSEILINEYETIERDELLELVQEIYNSGQRLHRLIQNTLLYAELELAEANLDRIKLLQGNMNSVKHVISHVAEKKARLENRENDLILEIEDGAINISETNLEKILEELLDNAFKFSSSGHSVHIIARFDNMFHLYITDRGRGMTPLQIADIGAYIQFERKIYEQQGVGLGLIITRRLVEFAGGNFIIESEAGKGTTVQVSLPCA